MNKIAKTIIDQFLTLDSDEQLALAGELMARANKARLLEKIKAGARKTAAMKKAQSEKTPTRAKSFLSYLDLNSRTPKTGEMPGELISVPVDNDFPPEANKTLRIFVWGDAKSSKGSGLLLEAHGNKNIKLVGKYYYRYDPPRTASTGSQQVPKGDWHLFNNRTEIAAWDDVGKARHGFAPGTKIPNKAYDALNAKYPNAIGLKGKLLEDILKKFDGKSLLTEG